jgi:hypothetical protein
MVMLQALQGSCVQYATATACLLCSARSYQKGVVPARALAQALHLVAVVL